MEMNIKPPKAVYLLDRFAYDLIYGPDERHDIARLTQLDGPVLTAETWSSHPDICEQAEVIFSGWGMPVVDDAFLRSFPQLKAVFYGAGSIRGFATDKFWMRDIAVTSAYKPNAVPVCEFTVAQIVLSTKRVWGLSSQVRRSRTCPHPSTLDLPGMYGSVVGLISLGTIGCMVADRLRQYDIKVIAYDPVVDPALATDLDVELCSLSEVFTRADVVSCHAPYIEETEGMLCYEHFMSMKHGATFINTARGAVVDETGLIAAMRERTDLHALLDVTWPEPPVPESPLYTLPNVLLTPHVAGSVGKECRRMGRTMVNELKRYLNGQPLEFGISRDRLLTMA